MKTCTTCGDNVENIVQLLEHDCDRVLSAGNLTAAERDTLTYLESCVVDHDGKLDPQKMNVDDRNSLKTFKVAGILEVEDEIDGVMTVTEFTDAAWELAWECRRLRADV
jgi:hypothetical protein